MSDSLWIGVDGIDEGGSDVPALNIFRRNGDSFDLVKMFDGDEALRVYKLLTEKGDDTLATEVQL